MNKIIYPNNLSISIIIPVNTTNVIELGKNLVPHGLPFKIIDESLVFSNRTFRDAWEYDFSDPDGYGENNDSY